MLDRIEAALQQNASLLDRREKVELRSEHLTHLTPREREIMAMAVAGQPNKVIAKNLGISHRTVEVHRSRILQKMGVTTMLELAHLLAELGIEDDATATPRAPQY